MENILTVKNLAVRLEGELLIHDVNFELARGESMAVIGPNGAGKTVMLKALLGLLPHEGDITWIPGIRVGYVPQKIDLDRHIPLNGMEIFEAKCRVLKIATSNIFPLMEKVGLAEETARTPVGHLSGGQFQKMLIVLALLGNPAVLFFDEPTANLDESAEGHIYELIHRLEDANISVLIISHDLEIVTTYVDKVFCINVSGICYGAPDEVLTASVLEKLYGTKHEHYHAMSEKDL